MNSCHIVLLELYGKTCERTEVSKVSHYEVTTRLISMLGCCFFVFFFLILYPHSLANFVIG